MATDTPGFESMATVTFRTAGRVEVGGKVKLAMPPQDLGDTVWLALHEWCIYIT